jgi:hypothetical protein
MSAASDGEPGGSDDGGSHGRRDGSEGGKIVWQVGSHSKFLFDKTQVPDRLISAHRLQRFRISKACDQYVVFNQ